MIGALEDAEDYKALEAAIIADYDVESAVERELVLRLASPLSGDARCPAPTLTSRPVLYVITVGVRFPNELARAVS